MGPEAGAFAGSVADGVPVPVVLVGDVLVGVVLVGVVLVGVVPVV